jgi:alpha-galactosidase
MDMLEIGTGSMNEFQEQTHQSFWAALKSPLIIGADITKMNQTSLDILLNEEIIAINQDDLGTAISYVPELSVEGNTQIWAGPLTKGYVILALNYGNMTTDILIPWSKVPVLKTKSPFRYGVRDVWAGKELGVVTDSITLKNVSVAQTKVLRLSSA